MPLGHKKVWIVVSTLLAITQITSEKIHRDLCPSGRSGKGVYGRVRLHSFWFLVPHLWFQEPLMSIWSRHTSQSGCHCSVALHLVSLTWIASPSQTEEQSEKGLCAWFPLLCPFSTVLFPRQLSATLQTLIPSNYQFCLTSLIHHFGTKIISVKSGK